MTKFTDLPLSDDLDGSIPTQTPGGAPGRTTPNHLLNLAGVLTRLSALESGGVGGGLNETQVRAIVMTVLEELGLTGSGTNPGTNPGTSTKLATPVLSPTSKTWTSGSPPSDGVVFTITNRSSYPAGVDLDFTPNDGRFIWNSDKSQVKIGGTAMSAGSVDLAVKAIPGTATGYVASDSAVFTVTVAAANAPNPVVLTSASQIPSTATGGEQLFTVSAIPTGTTRSELSDSRAIWNVGKTVATLALGSSLTPGSSLMVTFTDTNANGSTSRTVTIPVTGAVQVAGAYSAADWVPYSAPTGLPADVVGLPALTRSSTSGAVQGMGYSCDTTIAARYTSHGLVIEQGKLAANQDLNFTPDGGTASPYQVDAKVFWPDGSVKLASVSGLAPALSAGVLKKGLWTTRAKDTAAALNPAGLDLSGFSASITIRSANKRDNGGSTAVNQTVDVSPAAIRAADSTPTVWRQGPLCTDLRYEKPIIPGIKAVMNLRMYPANFEIDLQIRAEENFFSNPNDTVSWFHDFVFKQGTTNIVSISNVRISVAQLYHKVVYSDLPAAQNAWIFPPVPVPVFDAPIWSVIGAIPPFHYSAGVNADLLAAYGTEATATGFRAPLSNNGIDMDMRGTGARRDLGVIPGPASDFFGTGDIRAYKLALGMAEASGAIPWNYYDPEKGVPLNFFPTIGRPGVWPDGRGSNPANFTIAQHEAAGWYLDMAHQPNAAYFGYLVTMDEYFHDLFAYYTCFNMIEVAPYARERGKDGADNPTMITQVNQVREAGWRLVAVGYASEYLPGTNPLRPKLRECLKYNFDSLVSFQPAWQAGQGGPNGPYGAHAGIDADPLTHFKPWMDDHVVCGVTVAYMAGCVEAGTHMQWKANWHLGRFRAAGAAGGDYKRYTYYEGDVGDIRAPNWDKGNTWPKVNTQLQPPGEGTTNGWANGNYALLALRSVAQFGIVLRQDVSDIFTKVLGDTPYGATLPEVRAAGMVDSFRPPAATITLAQPGGTAPGGDTPSAPTVAAQNFSAPANTAPGVVFATVLTGGGTPTSMTIADTRLAITASGGVSLKAALADSTVQTVINTTVTASNAAGSTGAVAQTFTFTAVAAGSGTTAPSNFFAATNTTMYDSYSMRPNGGYTGALIRLRRVADGVEQDFSASGGMIDKAAITTWLSAVAAGNRASEVVRWYGQKRSGLYWAPLAAANRLKFTKADGTFYYMTGSNNTVPCLAATAAPQILQQSVTDFAAGTKIGISISAEMTTGPVTYARLLSFMANGQVNDWDNGASAHLLGQNDEGGFVLEKNGTRMSLHQQLINDRFVLTYMNDLSVQSSGEGIPSGGRWWINDSGILETGENVDPTPFATSGILRLGAGYTEASPTEPAPFLINELNIFFGTTAADAEKIHNNVRAFAV